MPLVRLEVRNEYGLGDPELYRAATKKKDDPKELLDGVAVAGLVGILRQLGDLAEFDSAGPGSCLKKYSDPSYFKRVLATSELEKAEKVQREKKAQKIKRRRDHKLEMEKLNMVMVYPYLDIIAGLPGLDSFTSTHDKGKCDSLSTDPEDSASKSQNGLPPLPPLPPMQWMMTKSSFDKHEDKDYSVAEIVERFNVLRTQVTTGHKQQEPHIPKPPPYPEALACLIKKSHGGQVNEHKETRNNGVNSKQLDGREELLHQIKSKRHFDNGSARTILSDDDENQILAQGAGNSEDHIGNQNIPRKRKLYAALVLNHGKNTLLST